MELCVMIKYFELYFSFLCCLLCAGCIIESRDNKNNNSHPTVIEPVSSFCKQGELELRRYDGSLAKKISIEVAQTPARRERGLMYRVHMREDEGMLFIFPAPLVCGFYMKNTHIPLDIIFVNANKKIVMIYTHARPYSLESLSSGFPIVYAVEVNAGFCDRYNIHIGDTIFFTFTDNSYGQVQ
jgi:uncharacterized membrane protein (UPF0127 family)